ncbi:MAG: hypothetical protein A2138_19720 [Deltaproteobacteria bacterium RBG_16_71_12]|nr:MAG: hypothetical protein A2138_19720 [Deltaproteobacteria bacterium RBG_16_71_12]
MRGTPLLLAAALVSGAALAAPDGPNDDLPQDGVVRQLIAEAATAQVKAIDPTWQEAQRDCAGLVRFAYRSAFARLRADGKAPPLFTDHHGRKVDFADAETLVTRSFTPLGRGDEARRALRSGDLLAFSGERADGEVVWHLMLAVVPAPGTEARVVYHPGEAGARVRTGTLAALEHDAPFEWRPTPENPSFLGFFRFRDFARPLPGGPS